MIFKDPKVLRDVEILKSPRVDRKIRDARAKGRSDYQVLYDILIELIAENRDPNYEGYEEFIIARKFTTMNRGKEPVGIQGLLNIINEDRRFRNMRDRIKQKGVINDD